MPWTTPTLRETRTLTRDYVLSQLGARAMIPNSVLRIMSDAMSGLAHLTLLYIDWLSKQLLPDTAETEWLDRHGVIWLLNADGSKGRKTATYAKGTVEFSGTGGITVPVGAVLVGAQGVQYQTTSEAEINDTGIGTATAVALTAGTIGNLPAGTQLGFALGTGGVDSCQTRDDMTGGTDAETDDQLRERVLFRIQNPPMGGSEADYVRWAMAVPGVTRAWCAPLEMGIGTVTVRFMMDELRADQGGFPGTADVAVVAAYMDTVRPVAVKDIFVVAPVPQPIDVYLLDLQTDNPTTRGEIEKSLNDLLLRQAAPGQTIYAAWKYNAVMNAPGVQNFALSQTADDVMASPGHMAILGDIIYELSH